MTYITYTIIDMFNQHPKPIHPSHTKSLIRSRLTSKINCSLFILVFAVISIFTLCVSENIISNTTIKTNNEEIKKIGIEVSKIKTTLNSFPNDTDIYELIEQLESINTNKEITNDYNTVIKSLESTKSNKLISNLFTKDNTMGFIKLLIEKRKEKDFTTAQIDNLLAIDYSSIEELLENIENLLNSKNIIENTDDLILALFKYHWANLNTVISNKKWNKNYTSLLELKYPCDSGVEISNRFLEWENWTKTNATNITHICVRIEYEMLNNLLNTDNYTDFLNRLDEFNDIRTVSTKFTRDIYTDTWNKIRELKECFIDGKEFEKREFILNTKLKYEIAIDWLICGIDHLQNGTSPTRNFAQSIEGLIGVMSLNEFKEYDLTEEKEYLLILFKGIEKIIEFFGNEGELGRFSFYTNKKGSCKWFDTKNNINTIIIEWRNELEKLIDNRNWKSGENKK